MSSMHVRTTSTKADSINSMRSIHAYISSNVYITNCICMSLSSMYENKTYNIYHHMTRSLRYSVVVAMTH